MSLVMIALYTTLDVTLKARDQIEIQGRVARLGPQILDLIESDLRRAWVLDIEDDKVFLGESRTIDGEPADSLSFLTNVDSSVTHRVGEREVSSDVCETGYRLRRNPDLPDVLELWRRQSFHVDEEPLKDGVYELLHDRVVRFQVRYLNTMDPQEEELHDWDASLMHRLPAAVEIELALEAVPRSLADDSKAASSAAAANRTLVYKRVIPLVDHSDLIMRAHNTLPPTFVAAGGTSGGSNLGGDGAGGANPATGGEGSAGGMGGSGGGGGGSGGGGGQGGGGGGGADDFQKFLDELLGGGGGK